MTEPRADTEASTTGRPALVAGVFWTFFGQGVPLAVALLTVPVLVAGYGTDRFGVLALVWAAVGYFTLFDLGMGRALTQWVAGRVDRHAGEDTGATIWTALALMGLLGVLGGGVLAALTPWLVETVLSMPQELVGEARTSFLLMAFMVPLLTLDQGLRGILEAHLKFAIVNAVRIPFGTLTQIGPLFLLLFSNSLVPAVAMIVLCRVAEGLIYLRYCLRLQPELRGRIRIHLRSVLPLARFGGWMTVSNVIGPLMVYFDRFLIGSLLSVAATAYYAAPYDLVTRLWIVPGAFCAVLFPAFAASARSDSSRVVRLYVGGLKYTFLSLFPLVFLVVIFAPDLLTLWIGAEFARESTGVLQILALGVLVNSLAYIAFALVQGLGRADVTAKFHLLEAPFYLALLWWGITAYGIEGAAVAWTIRVAVDAALLAIASTRLAGCPPRAAARVGLALGLGGVLAVLVAIAGSVVTKLMLAIPILCVFLMLSWFFALSAEDRQFLTFRGAMR